MSEEKYYTIDEVASMVHVVYLTVYRWIQAGRLKAYKTGKKYLIKDEDLHQLITAYDRKHHEKRTV